MKKVVLGIVIGFALSIVSTIYAEPTVQYILTKVNYPIVVDGKVYQGNNNPVLNYNGTTYVPLRAVAELLGMNISVP